MWRGNIRRHASAVIAIVLASVAVIVGTSHAWPDPVGSGTCDSYKVQEVAPDGDWLSVVRSDADTAGNYTITTATTTSWSIDGVGSGYARAQQVAVPDTTTGTTRTFTVHWYGDYLVVKFNANDQEIGRMFSPGVEFDARSVTVNRDLSSCQSTQPTAAVEANGAADCDGVVQQWSVTVTGTDWPEGATVTVVGQVDAQVQSGLKPGDTITVSWKPASWVLSSTNLGGSVPTTATPPDNCPESSPATVLTPATCYNGGSILLENAVEATGPATFIVVIAMANTSLQQQYDVDPGKSVVVPIGLKSGETATVTVTEEAQTLLDFVTVTRPAASACGGVIPPTE